MKAIPAALAQRHQLQVGDRMLINDSDPWPGMWTVVQRRPPYAEFAGDVYFARIDMRQGYRTASFWQGTLLNKAADDRALIFPKTQRRDRDACDLRPE